ncbi:conserved hypothetical protein [Aspergillus terreus NIH2624]|uniref:Uncharacterized protein n=1 Tax=Aspergillus terreus (strain NIH 2624 / FGSC A1156) TaxID=341663 RepID=Q0CND6_ASPTN|nr:uncharacterized protein ATEG_04798 [Aspergillus terreus NIH2624]EAU35245.1 conserved hypothetical protein [Aspergillus terreus NIH2624]
MQARPDAPGLGQQERTAGGVDRREVAVGGGRGVGDEDVGGRGHGAGPGVVVRGVGKGVFGAEGDDGGDVGGAVEGEGAGAGCCGAASAAGEGEGDGGVLEVDDVAPVDAGGGVVCDGVQGGGGGGDLGKGVFELGVVAVVGEARAHVKVAVVVAADDDLVAVGEAAQPVDGGLNLAHAAVIAEVAGVDEQVAVGHVSPF